MTIYTIKLKNKQTARYELIALCMTYAISVFITWQDDSDIFEGYILADVAVPANVDNKFMAKYSKSVIAMQQINEA